MAADTLSRIFSALADPTRRDGQRARRTVRDVTAGGLQAPPSAGGRRGGQPSAWTAAAVGAPGGGGLRPDGQLDRALSAQGRRALPPSRRRTRGDEPRRAEGAQQ